MNISKVIFQHNLSIFYTKDVRENANFFNKRFNEQVYTMYMLIRN